jgi:hypothetical protein
MAMWRLAAAGLVVGACGSGGSPVDAPQSPLHVMTWTVDERTGSGAVPCGLHRQRTLPGRRQWRVESSKLHGWLDVRGRHGPRSALRVLGSAAHADNYPQLAVSGAFVTGSTRAGRRGDIACGLQPRDDGDAGLVRTTSIARCAPRARAGLAFVTRSQIMTGSNTTGRSPMRPVWWPSASDHGRCGGLR